MTNIKEPFGYWCECKGADPVFLRKPAWIPPNDGRHNTTPLYDNTLAEAVAWRGDNLKDKTTKFNAIKRVSEIWKDQGLNVTPLYTLDHNC